MKKDKLNLIVPVYLNQKLVFDLLAMLKGGISTVTQISKEAGTSNSVSWGASAKFGLSDALATLFKVDLSTSLNAKTDGEDKETHSFEKIHTPSSLFFELKNQLQAADHIKSGEALIKCEPGDFVEFEVILTRNPMEEIIAGMAEVMKIATIFEESSDENTKLLQYQINSFSENLASGNTIDLVAQFENKKLSAVVTLDKSFLNDPQMSDLVDGQFRILGKVTRKISTSAESISLLRNSALRIIGESTMGELISAFDNLEDSEFNIPEVKYEVCGPAIQVIPIAIYA